MGKIAIVTTSVNEAPEAYAHWAEVGTLIVAGDLNSPPKLETYVRNDLGGVYLSPEYQQDYAWSESVGWKNIQRRNAAIMYALQQRDEFDYLLTVDDDNAPARSAREFVDGHIDAINHTPHSVVTARVGSYLNTGVFCEPQFHQRGVPYGVNTDSVVRRFKNTPPTVVVSQAQVLGDPDCDAIERIVNHPFVKAVKANVTIEPGTYTAFNSQATLWRRDWAPVMAVLPNLGRYDDIFASFVFARLARTYNVALFVGEPCVVQTRNDHDLTKDLAAEVWGMSNVFTFCALLDRAHISASMPLWQAYDELIYATRDVLPRATATFAKLWVDDWRKL